MPKISPNCYWLDFLTGVKFDPYNAKLLFNNACKLCNTQTILYSINAKLKFKQINAKRNYKQIKHTTPCQIMSYRYNLSQLTIGTSHSSKVTSTKQTLHTDVHTIVLLISIDEDSKTTLCHKQLMATPCQAKRESQQAKQAMTIHQSTSQAESRYDMYTASLKI
jgi:hypothetical protein